MIQNNSNNYLYLVLHYM